VENQLQIKLFQYEKYDKAKLALIKCEDCVPHELNPRLTTDDDLVARIANQIKQYGYKPEHAILVRRYDSKYQILSGHTRWRACQKVNADLWAWIAENISDQEAHSLLLLENEQSELTPLEKGKHAYEHIQMVGKGKGGKYKKEGIKEYTDAHNYKSDAIVHQWMSGYEVVLKTSKNLRGLSHSILYEISKSPEAAWQALCRYALQETWTVEQTKKVVNKIKTINPTMDYGYDMEDIYSISAEGKGKLAKKYSSLFELINTSYESLPEAVTLFYSESTGEEKEENYQVYIKHISVSEEYKPKSVFLQRIREELPREEQAVKRILSNIELHMELYKAGGDKWIPKRTEEEIGIAKEKARREAHERWLDERLILGDMEYKMANIAAKSVQLIVTDPPYGLGETSNIQFEHREDMAKSKGKWDNAVHYAKWLKLFKRVLADNASVYIFAPDREVGNLWHALEENEFTVRNIVVWHKTNPAPKTRQKEYCDSCEYILFATLGNDYIFNWQGQNEMHNHIEMPICQGAERLDHPTQKPVKLLDYLISISSSKEGMVLDPFAGVGSTGIAANNLGRNFRMIEIDEEYYRQARLRFSR
jgi:site-specific DNA-methyltransferase (adenine-specific)/modification methylase